MLCFTYELYVFGTTHTHIYSSPPNILNQHYYLAKIIRTPKITNQKALTDLCSI